MKPVLLLAALLSIACSRSNNVFMGRVEDTVAGHKIVVTDCYRTSVPAPQQPEKAAWRWTPCRDADIWIRGDELEVNGRWYGKIGVSDAILVDHGKVSVTKP
jgi:hypothetical protein